MGKVIRIPIAIVLAATVIGGVGIGVAQSASGNRCSQIPGSWQYTLGNLAILSSAGGASVSGKSHRGTWRCLDARSGRIEVDWRAGFIAVDGLILSADGTTLTGQNNFGVGLTLKRVDGGSREVVSNERGANSAARGRPAPIPPSPEAGSHLWGALACYRMKAGGSGQGVALNQPSEAVARKVALSNCAADKRGIPSGSCYVTAVFSAGCRYGAIGLNGCSTGATAEEALARCQSEGMNNGEECQRKFIEGGCLGR